MTARDVDALLDTEVARDPTPPERRRFGHLFVVAQPDGADEELFVRGLDGGSSRSWFLERLAPGLLEARWAPDIQAAEVKSRRAYGWAIHNGVDAARAVGADGCCGLPKFPTVDHRNSPVVERGVWWA